MWVETDEGVQTLGKAFISKHGQRAKLDDLTREFGRASRRGCKDKKSMFGAWWGEGGRGGVETVSAFDFVF
jgi:hypothetical protein